MNMYLFIYTLMTTYIYIHIIYIYICIFPSVMIMDFYLVICLGPNVLESPLSMILALCSYWFIHHDWDIDMETVSF